MPTDATRLKLGFVVIEPTFRCNVRCDHCIHECSPERRERLTPPLFRSCIAQAAQLGCGTICLSGGEPFLVPGYVRVAGELCRESGANLVVQTNGFWGRDYSNAQKILAGMPGITQMGFSVDKAHLKELGLDPLLNAITATIEAGILNVSLSISFQSTHEFSVLKQVFTSRYPGIEVEGWPILPIGRAKRNPELTAGHAAFAWEQLQRNCDAQRRLNPVVHPNGDLHACYRPVMALDGRDPLVLGNLKEHTLAELLRNVDNRLFMYIVAYGGGGLGYLLHKSPHEELLKRKYQAVCHFCYEVLSRPDVVSYLRGILASGEVAARVAAGLEQAYGGWKENAAAVRERIVICNGASCGRNHRNYPIIHYLLNRVMEAGKTNLVKVETVNCLKSCGTGPNLYLADREKLVQGVNMATIDAIVAELGVDGHGIGGRTDC